MTETKKITRKKRKTSCRKCKAKNNDGRTIGIGTCYLGYKYIARLNMYSGMIDAVPLENCDKTENYQDYLKKVRELRNRRN